MTVRVLLADEVGLGKTIESCLILHRLMLTGRVQRVLILVDGRPAGATSMGNIAAAGIERVEVLKGSASALYGASAMGGVVNFITRKSEGAVAGGSTLSQQLAKLLYTGDSRHHGRKLTRFHTVQSPACRIEVLGAGPGELVVTLPADAEAAFVEVNGRVLAAKEGGELRSLAPRVAGSAAEPVFRAGN